MINDHKNDELLDLVNEKDEVIGTVWKSEAHSDPSKIHREAGVLVFTKDNYFLMSMRSLRKKHAPGEWEIGPSGHVKANESPRAAAEREMLEELGLKGEIQFSYKFFSKYKNEARFFWVYYLILDSKNGVNIDFDKEEIEKTRWINLIDLKKFVDEHKSHSMDGSYKVVLRVLKSLDLDLES